MTGFALLRCGSDEHLRACPLSVWRGGPTCCRWCNTLLRGRRRRWCSDECVVAFDSNHWWNVARHAAMKRDGNQCVTCGWEGDEYTDYGVGPPAGTRGKGLQVHHLTPLHTLRITTQVWRYGAEDYETVERRVTHSDGGCWHHQEGLRSLCQEHHTEAHRELARQATMPGQERLDS